MHCTRSLSQMRLRPWLCPGPLDPIDGLKTLRGGSEAMAGWREEKGWEGKEEPKRRNRRDGK